MTFLDTITSVATRSRSTLLEDAVGAGSLMIILFVILHMPIFV